MRGLGRIFDIGLAFAPVDTQTGANTGKRIRMSAARNVAFVLIKGAGSGSDAPVFTLQEHNALSGGTSQNLAAITKVYGKSATTMANTEVWVKTTQAAAATLTLTGEATKQGIYVIEVAGDSQSDGFNYMSMSVADTGAAGAQLGTLIYIVSDLEVMRDPANLVALLT